MRFSVYIGYLQSWAGVISNYTKHIFIQEKLKLRLTFHPGLGLSEFRTTRPTLIRTYYGEFPWKKLTIRLAASSPIWVGCVLRVQRSPIQEILLICYRLHQGGLILPPLRLTSHSTTYFTPSFQIPITMKNILQSSSHNHSYLKILIANSTIV